MDDVEEIAVPVIFKQFIHNHPRQPPLLNKSRVPHLLLWIPLTLFSTFPCHLLRLLFLFLLFLFSYQKQLTLAVHCLIRQPISVLIELPTNMTHLEPLESTSHRHSFLVKRLQPFVLYLVNAIQLPNH